MPKMFIPVPLNPMISNGLCAAPVACGMKVWEKKKAPYKRRKGKREKFHVFYARVSI